MTIKIAKPRKQDDGTYFADIYSVSQQQTKPSRYTLSLQHAYVKDVKELKREKVRTDDSSTYTLSIQQDNIVPEIVRLNDDVLSIVKASCVSWFKANLTSELIEEYYANNIMYDKKGRYLKFRCVNDLSGVPTRTIVNITMVLQGIRFYKQQFVLEWNVDEVEIIEDDSNVSVDEDIYDHDIPEPFHEDVAGIRAKQMARLQAAVEGIQQEIDTKRKHLSELQRIMERLQEKNNSIENIFALCDQVDDMLE